MLTSDEDDHSGLLILRRYVSRLYGTVCFQCTLRVAYLISSAIGRYFQVLSNSTKLSRAGISFNLEVGSTSPLHDGMQEAA
jgi:hypothetical protein